MDISDEFYNFGNIYFVAESNEFPGVEYETHPKLPFALEFVLPKTIRIRMKSGVEVGPEDMISDLDDMGFKVSLWQLLYFVPKNDLFYEILNKGLYVKNNKEMFLKKMLCLISPIRKQWNGIRKKFLELSTNRYGTLSVHFPGSLF